MEFRYIRFERLRFFLVEDRNIRGFRFFLVVVDNFSKFGWTVPLENKNSQTIKDSLKMFLRLQKENQT